MPILPTATIVATIDNGSVIPVPPAEATPTLDPMSVVGAPTEFLVPTPTAPIIPTAAANSAPADQAAAPLQYNPPPTNVVPPQAVSAIEPTVVSLYLLFFLFGAFAVTVIGFALLLMVVYMLFARVQPPQPNIVAYPSRRLRRRKRYV